MPVDRLPNAETFLLKVQGESMVNAGILDGDLVLVEQQATAENGEKIVALVNDSATVKTFYKEKRSHQKILRPHLPGTADRCKQRI